MSSTASASNSAATGRSPLLRALPIGASYSSELPIAFSKIDGFDVTPLTPSSSISRLRSPLAMKPRARKSSQIAWPCCSSFLTGFMGLSICAGLLFGRFQHSAQAGFCQWNRPSLCAPPPDNAIHNGLIQGESQGGIGRFARSDPAGAAAAGAGLVLEIGAGCERNPCDCSSAIPITPHFPSLDRSRQQIRQRDLRRLQGVAAGDKLEPGLGELADPGAAVGERLERVECLQRRAVHRERNCAVIRPAGAIEVVLDVAEYESHLSRGRSGGGRPSVSRRCRRLRRPARGRGEESIHRRERALEYISMMHVGLLAKRERRHMCSMTCYHLCLTAASA